MNRAVARRPQVLLGSKATAGWQPTGVPVAPGHGPEHRHGKGAKQ